MIKIQLNLSGKGEIVSALPALKNRFHPVDMTEWWATEAVHTVDSKPLTRKMLVLSAAEKGGGVHCDEDLDPFYAKIMDGDSFDFGLIPQDLVLAGKKSQGNSVQKTYTSFSYAKFPTR